MAHVIIYTSDDTYSYYGQSEVEQEKIFDEFKNNNVNTLNSYDYKDDNYYKRIFELLITNSSISSLSIVNDNGSDEFYKLLADFLILNSCLHTLLLVDNSISIKNCQLISDALKNNTTLSSIHIRYHNLDNDMLKYLVNSLKYNKSLIFVGISVWGKPINAEIITTLLNNNTILAGILLYSNKIEKEYMLKKVLKNNPYITSCYIPSCLSTYGV
jgi:hypothetical protein